jgi:hypothetical protein
MPTAGPSPDRLLALAIIAFFSFWIWMFLELFVLQEIFRLRDLPSSSLAWVIPCALMTFLSTGLVHYLVRNTLAPVILSFLGVIWVGMLTPALLRPSPGPARLKACRKNLRALASALDSYAGDNDGYYPRRLLTLVPKYIKSLPTCPSNGKITYSENYLVSSKPAAYTLMCTGLNHRDAQIVLPNFPQYSAAGLVNGPPH